MRKSTVVPAIRKKSLAKLLKPPTSKWRKPKQLLMMMAVAVGKQNELRREFLWETGIGDWLIPFVGETPDSKD